MTKAAALIRVTIAYVVALAVAAAWLAYGADTRSLWLDTLIADILATAVIFGFSRAYRNSSFYDAYWSVIPPAIVIYWWAARDVPAGSLRAWLAVGVVMLWAIRLTGNWAYGWPGMHHEDWRYPMLREKSGRFAMVVDFLGIHLFPTLQVFLGTVPLYVVLTRPGRDIGWLDAVATAVGVAAVVIEFAADRQLHRFVKERQPGQVMNRGLWSWSRHPNYFGEITFWLSLALFAVAAAPREAWWLFAGTVAMLAMFLGASIPMMEQRSLERRPTYQEVIDRVPMLRSPAPAQARGMTGARVVVAGLGDTGLLTSIHLAGRADVVGISAKPGLVSGQELGVRLTRPDDWAKRYWVAFDRYRGWTASVRCTARSPASTSTSARSRWRSRTEAPPWEPYDVLVIATGVANGLWRARCSRQPADVQAGLQAAHGRLASAGSIAVIGGGAAAVSAAGNAALTWPDKRIDLYFPSEAALAEHHPRVWRSARRTLEQRGVGLHPGHRAVVPAHTDRLTGDPVQWATGQPATVADAVLWAVGRVQPNTGWLPAELLDEAGFVRVNAHLQSATRPEIFAIGDVAATDPLRSSARNRADRLLAGNVRAHLGGRAMRSFKPPRRRWGSVFGVQPNGLQVFTTTGHPFRMPGWSIDTVLWPWIVRRGIYRGVRPG